MIVSACPSLHHLLAFSAGKLPGVEHAAVVGHLGACPSCLELLQASAAEGDELLVALRRPLPEPHVTDESCQRVLGLVEAVTLLAPLGGETVSGELPPAPGLPQLGDYTLLGRLGRGGMGTVYKAVQKRLGKIVTVKLLPPDRVGSAKARTRFRREVEAIGRLEHPHIVRALDAREENGTHFLVMEYLDGTDLGKLVWQRGPFPVADACEAIRQAALGLQHAHEQCGLVHRDVKPSNLLLTPGGVVKVLDLGLARWDREQPAEGTAAPSDPTGDGIVGTGDYMAPEQWLDSRGVDSRADVYSLGCTLFHLLAGRPPFAGPGCETQGRKMFAHAQTPPPSVRVFRPDAPRPLERLLDRMLAKDRADRPATPGEVAEALYPFAEGHELPALVRPGAAAPYVPHAPAEANGYGHDKPTPFVRQAPPASNPRAGGLSSLLAVAGIAMPVLAICFIFLWAGGVLPDLLLTPVVGTTQTVVPTTEEEPTEPRRAAQAADEVVELLCFEHYRFDKATGNVATLGEIGPSAVLLNDPVVVRARFAEPVYAYLLVLNPDATWKLLYPEMDEPAAVTSFAHPPGAADYLSLDSEGTVSLVLLAAREPLPPFDEWRPVVDARLWKDAAADGPWRFDGRRCLPVGKENAGRAGRGPQVFDDLCHILKGRNGVVVVRAVLFAVQPAEEAR